MRQEVDSRARLVIIGVIVVALFTGLLTRLWFLQVAGGEKLAVRAQNQADRTVPVPALRGSILDAKGRVLATTVLQRSLVVDRQKLSTEQKAALIPQLASLLGSSPEEIAKDLDSQQYSPYEPVPVAGALSLEQFNFVNEHAQLFPHTSISNMPRRVYPHGIVATHVLGYIGKINSEEKKARPNDGYQDDDDIGKDGVELKYEAELRGTPGVDKVSVDNTGRVTNVRTVRDPVPGHDVQLSIDLDAQVIAQDSLQQGIDGAGRTVDPATGRYNTPVGGAVVVLDARTGQLVAMTSAPTFDPNDFLNGTADKYFSDPASPLIDRALSGYAPGSTFKLFSSIAMLQDGLRAPGDNVYDDGVFEMGGEGQNKQNAGKVAHGTVDLARALTVSSDFYYYGIGNDLWNQYRNENQDETDVHPRGYAIQDTARLFGFDAPTGVELPGDSSGKIPDRATNAVDFKDSPDEFARDWKRGDSADLAVGQGATLVTPLQLADGYAAFANGGTLHTPQLLKSILQSHAGLPDGQLGPVVRTTSPIVKTQTGLDPGFREAIFAGLHGVVYSPEGTAYAAFFTYEGPTVIGKTGTAQNTGKSDTSWFAAITNADNDPNLPQYVVIAMVEEGGFGAEVSAPIVRRVIDYLNGNATPPPVTVAPYNPNAKTTAD